MEQFKDLCPAESNAIIGTRITENLIVDGGSLFIVRSITGTPARVEKINPTK